MATPEKSRDQRLFDKFSLTKYVKNIGRAYRKQAMELVSICRTFVQAQEQTQDSEADLRFALDLVDEALESAAEAKKETSEEANKRFRQATEILSDYEEKFHKDWQDRDTVRRRMKTAAENDKSRWTFLKKLSFHPIEPQPTEVVEFLLYKSLPDPRPTSVEQVLCKQSNRNEVLWNFTRFKDKKRLTLKQNPQFYSMLPVSSKTYEGQFRFDPVETFQYEKICILTDKDGPAGRVFLKTAEKNRAFGNAWRPNNAIIFKDVCGRLEGESIVGESFQHTPNLWYFKEPPRPSALQRTRSLDRTGPSPSTTGTPSRSVQQILMQDWKEPIREMLANPNDVQNMGINLCITFKPPPPGGSSHSNSAPASPMPEPHPGSSDASLLPILHSRSLLTTLQIQIPEPSAGSATPSNHGTARNVPPTERSPVAGLSSTVAAPLDPPRIAPSTSPNHSSPIVTPPLAASPVLHPPQQPTVALTLTKRVAPDPQAARSTSEKSRERASQRDSSPEVAPNSSLEPISHVPPFGTTTITPPEFRSTPMPHVGGDDGRIGRQLLSQSPRSNPEHVAGTRPSSDNATLPPPVQATDQHPPTQNWNLRKNWFQKYIWDYKNERVLQVAAPWQI